VSVALSVTLVPAAPNQLPQEPPLQLIDVVGAVESTSTVWLFICSKLPATSCARNSTVAEELTVNAPV
jgi:hypothetical protein